MMRLEDATRPELLTVLRALLQERDDLQRRVDGLEAAHDRLAREHAVVDREHAVVSQLHVASRLLHRSLDRGRVVTAILEVCIDLIGSEHVALFEREADRLRLIASYGVDQTAHASIPVGEGAIGEAARTAAIQLATSDGADADRARPAACVPLCVAGQAVGVLVLFRLLPHKRGFGQVDFALFELLSEQAGVALAATAEAR